MDWRTSQKIQGLGLGILSTIFMQALMLTKTKFAKNDANRRQARIWPSDSRVTQKSMWVHNKQWKGEPYTIISFYSCRERHSFAFAIALKKHFQTPSKNLYFYSICQVDSHGRKIYIAMRFLSKFRLDGILESSVPFFRLDVMAWWCFAGFVLVSL